ncbi:uncharacterized protein RSE6_12356 [Rhynchosporium secalis]|uniref:Uncharacterized protein n=1 Tax=Rhynchosporium secalis TaxID=38038 RepID=A0A1E1MQ83_RHYSE|nr:uncharacterized protein RSE6_12356 [Rhynchosporium secalis]
MLTYLTIFIEILEATPLLMILILFSHMSSQTPPEMLFMVSVKTNRRLQLRDGLM